MARTIKQISEICGVSEQAIRGWCKRNNVPKDAKGKQYVISESVECDILGHYGGLDGKVSQEERKVAKGDFVSYKLVEMLEKELKSKNEQIHILQESLKNTTEALKTSQESLKASQLLQANTEQRLLSLESQENTTPEPQKKSFFGWLGKK